VVFGCYLAAILKGMRMKPRNPGFTLVEVIVVAVIVAALAAVAIGIYVNYVATARTNAASNAGGAIASFCGACVNSAGTLSGTGLPGTVTGTITCTAPSGNTTINAPTDIAITVSNASASGTVTAKHVNSPAADPVKSFSY